MLRGAARRRLGACVALVAATLCLVGAGGGQAASAAANPTLFVELLGNGVVKSDFDAISCPKTCSTNAFKIGSTVTLTATADPAWAFSGWDGPCAGTSPTCTFTILGDTKATATFVPTHSLGVEIAGHGSVSSTPDGIACPSDCNESFASSTTVKLEATPAAGWTFSGWTDDCTGTSTCVLTMDKDRAVGAIFVPITHALAVTVSGQGTVSSAPTGIACPSDCGEAFASSTTVKLDTTSPAGWSFTGWSGDCTGTSTCVVTMDKDRSVQASFTYSGVSDLSSFAAEVFADGGAGGAFTAPLVALLDNKPPTPAISLPKSIRAGKTVVLGGAGSTDADGKAAGYRWDLDGDGVYDDGFGASVTFSFAHPGRQTVSLEVVDDMGRIAPVTRTITVGGHDAVASVASALHATTIPRPLRGGFDTGLGSWHAAGAAFAGPVQHSRWIAAGRLLDTNGRLGGSYADDIHVPVGSVGKGWVTSFRAGARAAGLSDDARGNLATGIVVSPAFRVDKPYLVYRLGGGGAFARHDERIEVWTRRGSQWKPVPSLTRIASGQEAMRPVNVSVKALRGNVAAVAAVDASAVGHLNLDDVRTVSRATAVANDPRYYTLAPARRVHFSPPPPIVGFADFHSHPNASQGFGALQGIRAYMGDQGGDVSLYDHDAAAFAHDVYGDDFFHFGGPLGAFGIDVAEGRRTAKDSGEALSSLIASSLHPRYGGPCAFTRFAFCDHPAHDPGTIGPAHEQMNVWEIHRAWEGGLRLLSSLTVNSRTLEYLAGFPHRYDGGPPETDFVGAPTEHNGDQSVNQIDVTPDRAVIEAQVEGMRQLTDLNRSWMQIAYDPEQAYEIMSEGKLAIVLGSEMDTNGALGFDTAQEEVDWLWGLGIRQVTPIHCCDNKIGGAALFQDAYNLSNDLLNRPTKDITAIRVGDDVNDQGFAIAPKPGFTGTPQVGYWMRAEAGCSPPDDVRGECVDWRFDTPNGTGASTSPHGDQSIVSVDSNALTAPFVGHATVHPAPWSRVPADKYGFYDSVHGGMRNVKGLTDYGRQYIQALMRHGMLVDLEHASEHTIDALIDPGTTAGHVRGPVWAFKPGPGCDVATTFNQASRSGDCWSFAYPLMSSHTSYRAQSLDPSQTTFKGFLPREFERTPDEIEYIRRSGGVVGPVVLQDPVQTIDTHVPHAAAPTWQIVDDRDWHTTSSPANDCAGSSKSWAQTYLYSLQKMGGQGVGLATDMLLVGGTSPRFGAPPGPFDLDPASIGRPYACDDSREAAGSAEDSADAQRIRALEESRDPGQYNRPAQSNTVNYAAPFTALPPGSHALRFETDPAGVTKSFNERGMVVYGQLPDLLQDVSNDGVTGHDLTPLFSAAQAYVNMWDKAYVLAGCYGGDFDRCANGDEGTPLDAATVCKNTCPNDPGRGLGLAPDGTPFVLSLPPFG